MLWRYWLLLWLFCPALLWAADPPHLHVARGFVGMTERGGANRGVWIDYWARRYGVPIGSSWCALFTWATADSAGAILPRAFGLATAKRWRVKDSHSAKDVLLGRYRPSPGDYIGWTHGNTWRGHAGWVDRWNGASGWTIEGNTSNGAQGSQHNGDGVYRRRRTIDPHAFFRVEFFTPIKYLY